MPFFAFTAFHSSDYCVLQMIKPKFLFILGSCMLLGVVGALATERVSKLRFKPSGNGSPEPRHFERLGGGYWMNGGAHDERDTFIAYTTQEVDELIMRLSDGMRTNLVGAVSVLKKDYAPQKDVDNRIRALEQRIIALEAQIQVLSERNSTTLP